MKNVLALAAIMFWPVIPLMWIPVHLATGFFRMLGRLTYFFVGVLWTVTAYLIFMNRTILVANKIDFPLALVAAGLILLVAGTLLHIWTAVLLSLRGIIGIPEIAATEMSKLVDRGPFVVVRHPTYLAHTIMFLGVFLFTGVTAVGVLSLIDIIVVNSFVIPLEERELLQRLGESYREYKKRVPRFIPRIHRKR